MERTPYSLAYYTERVKTMTDAEIHYARLDIAKTIELRKDLSPQDPYMAKLLNERDALLTEVSERSRRRK